MRKKQSGPKDQNYLPPHIGQAFESELVSLVANLPDDSFRNTYLKGEFLSKYCSTSESDDDMRRAAAIKKWLQVETRNQKTNHRIMFGDADFGWTTSDALIECAKGFITEVLAELDPDIIFPDMSHSNGASTRVTRGPTAQILKHGGKAHVSSTCQYYWDSWVADTRLQDQEISIQESSVMFTVPKNSEIDRVACKEPEINMLLQRRVGAYIKRRLQTFGIDLFDQSKNRNLAKVALERDLATIDLSSASDTITNQLVMALLPGDWWSFLDDLRVHYVDIDGRIHRLEMFSSMGNGFTFELESLIFWALTRSITKLSGKRGRISVFGDDIIAPVSVARRIAQTFSWFGFTVNSKKSAWSGKFRESCGGHYFDGEDVTPFYLRGPIRSKTGMIHMLNRLLLWDSYGYLTFLSKDLAEFHERWSHVIPRRLWGGQDAEDTTSLVTGHLPSHRLVTNTRPMEFPNSWALDFWFTAASKDRSVYLDKRILYSDRQGTKKMCFISSFFLGHGEHPKEGCSIEPALDKDTYSIKEYTVFCRSELTAWNPYPSWDELDAVGMVR